MIERLLLAIGRIPFDKVLHFFGGLLLEPGWLHPRWASLGPSGCAHRRSWQRDLRPLPPFPPGRMVGFHLDHPGRTSGLAAARLVPVAPMCAWLMHNPKVDHLGKPDPSASISARAWSCRAFLIHACVVPPEASARRSMVSHNGRGIRRVLCTDGASSPSRGRPLPFL